MQVSLKRRALKIATSSLFGLRMHNASRLRVLTFHSVQDHSDNNWHTSPKVFENQMRYLFEAGYRSLTIDGIADNWPEILQSKEKTVAVTFDDGLVNNFTTASIILEKFGMKATFFITTENICKQRNFPVSKGLQYFKDSQMMSWDDIRALHKKGFEIGSHGHSHDMIARMPESEALESVTVSKRIIESELNAEISSFAYPYGHKGAYAPWTREMLREAGFKAGCTQSGGALSICNDPLELPRIGIRGYDSLEVFEHKVSGCYDFLRWLE